MKIWNNIPNEEKLFLWKKLRESLTEASLNTKLAEIALFFAPTPFTSRTLDYYSPNSWPTPWEILFYNTLCPSSISLLIYYTLTMVDPSVKIELLLVEDEGGIYLLPLIDNKFILNYELGMISNYSEVKKDFKVIKTYSKNQIKSIK